MKRFLIYGAASLGIYALGVFCVWLILELPGSYYSFIPPRVADAIWISFFAACFIQLYDVLKRTWMKAIGAKTDETTIVETHWPRNTPDNVVDLSKVKFKATKIGKIWTVIPEDK